jgi:hypothetical protein
VPPPITKVKAVKTTVKTTSTEPGKVSDSKVTDAKTTDTKASDTKVGNDTKVADAKPKAQGVLTLQQPVLLWHLG